MKVEETQLFHIIKMQELGFRHNRPLLHSFLFPCKPNFLFRTSSMDSPLHFSSNFASFYPSAPPSPSRLLFSHQSSPNFGFFSVPNSPGRRAFRSSPSPSDDGTSATPDTTYGDKRSNVDEFDFETSRRSYADEFQHLDEIKEHETKCRRSQHESLPAIAFGDDVIFGTKETTYGDESFNRDEFEFETSRRFDADEFLTCHKSDEEVRIGEKKEHTKKCHWHHESLPAIAFADELFCEGKMMPLNPPPSQLHSSYSFNNTPSPVNPNAKFRIPFTRSLWNDDFDPFMVALETVKEEKREGHHRRARSMLPLKACTTFDDVEEHKNCLHSSPLMASSPMRMVKPNGPEVENHGPRRSPIRLTEPKGVMFARRARMVKMGYNYEKPITKQSPEPIVLQVGDNQRRRRNKWQKVLSFTKKRASEEKAEKDQSVEFAKSKLRKLSSKSNKMTQDKKEIQVATKMTLVRYRPKLLLCMGYGAKIA